MLPNTINYASTSVGIVNHVCNILENDMDIFIMNLVDMHTRPSYNKEYAQNLNIKVIEIEESMSRESLMLTSRQRTFYNFIPGF